MEHLHDLILVTLYESCKVTKQAFRDNKDDETIKRLIHITQSLLTISKTFEPFDSKEEFTVWEIELDLNDLIDVIRKREQR